LAGKKRKPKAPALVLIAGAKPQMRKRHANNWTTAKEKTFLRTLAETCNITRACAAADVGMTSVYRRRKENAHFRAACLTAIAIAYQQLELILLERAFNGHEKLIRLRGGETRTMHEYSDRLALSLLKMHRESAADAEFELPPDEIEEVRDRLIRKLQRMKKRDGE
jgi:hypothetical protein